MGPELLLVETADGLAWAQQVSSVTLPMVLNGPSMETADGLEWAQHVPSVKLLRETVDGFEWAQRSLVKLPMVSDEPSMSSL
jgi:hypothetical protein